MNDRPVDNNGDIESMMTAIGKRARSASKSLAQLQEKTRNLALRPAAASLRHRHKTILAENAVDIATARQSGATSAMLDRLALNEERIAAIAAGLENVAALADPLGRVVAEWQRPNGMIISRVAVPLGVIGMIYESRPNVTGDAAALCLKSGNAVILRGGSESFRSNRAIHESLETGMKSAGVAPACVQIIPTTDREAVGFLLSSMTPWVDVLIPRGGKNLIKRVQKEARIPVIGHLDGICHVYLHDSAENNTATELVLNAKMRRTGICGAAETVLVDASAAARLLPDVCAALKGAGCEIRGDSTVRDLVPAAAAATESDWGTEYLDAVIAIRVVPDIGAAIEHIGTYGSGHTDCIVANDADAAERFLNEVDSAIVLHNVSTQFADGGEFGMGAEIGIATGRIHARGPVGAEQLTSYKYVVRGNGQVRA